MATKPGDWRNRFATQTQVDAQLKTQMDALRAEFTAASNANLAQFSSILAAQQAQITELEKRKQLVPLGDFVFTIGSTIAVTLAGIKREVKPFAGVKPTDVLDYTISEYLPDGYGLPQITCRNAGQLEYRITVPAIALGTTKTITLAVSALR